MGLKRSTLILVGLTLLVLFVSVPGALRDAYERGGFYLFSQAFLEDLEMHGMLMRMGRAALLA